MLKHVKKGTMKFARHETTVMRYRKKKLKKQLLMHLTKKKTNILTHFSHNM